MSKSDNFTNVKLRINTLDIYHFRNAILTSTKAAIPYFKGNFLDVGCGNKPYKNLILQNKNISTYTGLDLENARNYGGPKADIFWTTDGSIPLPSESYDSAMATEVLEHCPKPEAIISEVYRVLKTDSFFFITVPFIWNLHEVPHDEYRYTPFALQRILNEYGFEIIKMEAHGGWNAALGLMLSLWCRRYIKNNLLKFTFSFFLLPLIAILYKVDTIPPSFSEGQMITGISLIAKKVKR